MFFSTDTVAAVILVSLALGLLNMSWTYYKIRLDETYHVYDMKYKANILSDILVKTPGEPVNWEEVPGDEVVSLGFARKDREIDPDKIRGIKYLSDQKIREILKTDQFNFQIIVRSLDGTIIKQVGDAPSGGISAKATRVVSYDGQTAFFELTVWGDKKIVAGAL